MVDVIQFPGKYISAGDRHIARETAKADRKKAGEIRLIKRACHQACMEGWMANFGDGTYSLIDQMLPPDVVSHIMRSYGMKRHKHARAVERYIGKRRLRAFGKAWEAQRQAENREKVR